jgi:exodeoxyribonuclease V beta subunit
VERDAREREARERVEREAREKVERESREKVERESREKVERDAREREIRESREKVERDAREREARDSSARINLPDDEAEGDVHRTEFDINNPLPFQSRVLIEASAGTGKTFSLTSLVARYVSEENLKIDQLLMVTFTKAAASEMRERTRAKLSEALTALNSEITPDRVKAEDIWMKPIVDCSGKTRDDRISRLVEAISGIDSATITTIHGFFQQALREVGLRSADTADSEIAQGKSSIAKQILRDELVTLFASGTVSLMNALPGKTPSDLEKQLLEIIDGLDSNISAIAAPEVDEGTVAFEWSTFVNQVRQKINEQRSASGTISFDDLITGLRDLLEPSMRARYRLVLIDEFQDTDDTQWDIFSKIFDVEYLKSIQGPIRTDETFLAMIMVGDPKQAIYRFRGADIAAYLKAVDDPKLRRFEMKRNFRSDRNLITGLNRWFQGKTDEHGKTTGFKFGNKNIAFIEVDAAKKGSANGLEIKGSPADSKAIQLRWIQNDHKPATRVEILRRRIAEDLCNHVTLLLNSGTIPDKREGVAIERAVQPGDISILVRAHRDADLIVEALRSRRIPVVKSNVGSVAQSEALDQLRLLLSAMASPNDNRKVKAVALSWFVGFSVIDLLDEMKISNLGTRCNDWAKNLLELGIVGFYQTLRAEESVMATISLSIEVERRLTDLEHLAELLHGKTNGKKLSAASVLRYLEEIATEQDDSDEHLRRIDSDAKAIQITTMHTSKGLEYPIVLIPYPKAPISMGAKVFTHEGQRFVNAAPGSPWELGRLNEEIREKITSEEIEGDDLRLMYVAFTRAKHQLVVWWANSKDMSYSPLARLLFGDHEDISIATTALDGDLARKRFNEIQRQIGADENGENIMHVKELILDESLKIPLSRVEVEVSSAGRNADFPAHATRNWNWRRWSFSSLSSSLKGDDSDSHEGGSDEGDPSSGVGEAVKSDGSFYTNAGLFTMPASAEFGTLVHEILEQVNFTSLALKEDLLRAINSYGPEVLRGIDSEELAQGLLDSLGTSLDPLIPGFKFTDLDERDRLAEMDFHFSLAMPEVSAENLALVVAEDKSSLFAEYFSQLAEKWRTDGGRGIAGLMTGSIDVLFRVNSGDRIKYFVVDYKSNRLHSPSEKVPHSVYGVESMKRAMEEHHYPLQALFYCVALHRFLSMRVGDYDIDRDLGGAGYLFVRGMVGNETPMSGGSRNGVLAWRPSSETILKVNALLGGESK